MNEHERREPPHSGSEKQMLVGFLDFLRDTMVWKLDGLTREQAITPLSPSGLTLLGIVNHLTDVEASWFRETFLGEDLKYTIPDDDPGMMWRIEPGESVEGILTNYRTTCEASNAIIAQHDLSETIARFTEGWDDVQLRWVVTHMIEETGRHCGHADLIREAIDGAVGE